MKNKKLTIVLIALLSVISVALIVLMVGVITGHFNFSAYNFAGHNVSNELVIDKTYENNFDTINIHADAGNIYVYSTSDQNARVTIYGRKENTTVKADVNRLSVTSKEKTSMFFNTTVAKIEIYLPENYKKNIDITNNYGDVNVEKFSNAIINIKEDCGDVSVSDCKTASIKNNYGDITLDNAESANIEESAGSVQVGNVNYANVHNSYGDIKIANVNSYMKLSNDCGDIKVENINLNKNSTANNSLGEIEIGSTNEIYIDASTSLGDVKINNNYNKSDITLTIKNSCGNIEVNN